MPRRALTPDALLRGPFLGSRAVSAGLVSSAMLKGPAWRRVVPNVYVVGAAFDPTDHRMWCLANALVMPPGAAIAGWSAAYLHGIDLLPFDAAVWVALPVTGRMRPRDRLRVHRTPLWNGDVESLDGIPVTTAIRTAFDLGRGLARTDALCAVDAMCHGQVLLDHLRAYAADRATWPGGRRLREVLDLANPLAESPMESRARLVLADAGAPSPTAQFEVRDDSGEFLGRLDLAYPELKIGIEYEGDHHRERHRFQQDIVRVNRLQEAGWLILRFTANDVLVHPDRLIRQVSAAIRSRRR